MTEPDTTPEGVQTVYKRTFMWRARRVGAAVLIATIPFWAWRLVGYVNHHQWEYAGAAATWLFASIPYGLYMIRRDERNERRHHERAHHADGTA